MAIDWDAISAQISSVVHSQFSISSLSSVGGGCINQAYQVRGNHGDTYFIKINSRDKTTMFEAEAAGLELILTSSTILAPRPITYGVADKHAFMVLEYLDLSGQGDSGLLGRQLAALHRTEGRQFGNARANFIGSSPQPNDWSDDWIEFWRERRLGFQLKLAARNGYGGKLQTRGSMLMDALPELFDGYLPRPSLLHGDLWGGNCGFLNDTTPVIFDPACYYGDREADIAMTELFGGFAADFYAAYRAAYPLNQGYRKRSKLYNLYHILNHANLFGGGYARQAEHMTDEALSEL
jgi:fructosamine-3-kinase